MERITAHNSTPGHVISYGWEPTSNFPPQVGPLDVEFGSKKNGSSVYRYSDVPHAKWLGLLQAPSAGAYLNAEIKNEYACTRIQ